nr:immunoglobulin heavy chain junction region [Mus musculus]NSM09179.1 immunoglobulin heavy chain junction region [Mus musculus]
CARSGDYGSSLFDYW